METAVLAVKITTAKRATSIKSVYLRGRAGSDFLGQSMDSCNPVPRLRVCRSSEKSRTPRDGITRPLATGDAALGKLNPLHFIPIER
jgi:hypothetical protein